MTILYILYSTISGMPSEFFRHHLDQELMMLMYNRALNTQALLAFSLLIEKQVAVDYSRSLPSSD